MRPRIKEAPGTFCYQSSVGLFFSNCRRNKSVWTNRAIRASPPGARGWKEGRVAEAMSEEVEETERAAPSCLGSKSLTYMLKLECYRCLGPAPSHRNRNRKRIVKENGHAAYRNFYLSLGGAPFICLP